MSAASVSPHMERFAGRRIAFRVDASLAIGSGHVMRCLTLAKALRAKGAECHFLCREHAGHLIGGLEAQGFAVHGLNQRPADDATLVPHPTSAPCDRERPEHADWLGTVPAMDAVQSLTVLRELQPDWLVVDHYALDATWQAPIRDALTALKLMVIDDLADRPHRADLLLDQNLGRAARDYQGRVPEDCCLLIGPTYALLRDEFAEWRGRSLARRQASPSIGRLLISLGGVDKDNVTGQVLDALCRCLLPEDLQISVVMGATAPWLDVVRQRAAAMPRPTEVVVNVDDMARRMAEADLAIGAAGSTSWERCCLGLPTLLLVLADNQQAIAETLHEAGIAHNLGHPDALAALPLQWQALTETSALAEMSATAAQVVDGQGVARVLDAMKLGPEDGDTRP